MILLLALFAAVAVFALYTLVVGLVVWGLVKFGFLNQPWIAAVVTPLLMIVWPLHSIWQDRVRANECLALNGPYELSCTGELGGLFISLFKVLVVLLSLVVGPIVGWRLVRRRRRPEGEVFN